MKEYGYKKFPSCPMIMSTMATSNKRDEIIY